MKQNVAIFVLDNRKMCWEKKKIFKIIYFSDFDRLNKGIKKYAEMK